MNIYVGHSRNYDYIEELYKPIRKSMLNSKYNIIFPHEEGVTFFKTKELLKDIDLMIAEVSYPATGLGIELGYADIYNVPVLCINQTGTKISGSLKLITNNFEIYNDKVELVEILEKYINTLMKNK